MSIEASRQKGGVYLNPVPTHQPGFGQMIPILREYIGNKAENTPKHQLGPFKTDTSAYAKPPKSGLRITWVGHSSLLIEIDGVRILTDPVWSDRVSFSQFIGPKRFFKPPLKLDELPPLDAIIISHDHYDHLDKATVKHFARTQIPFLCSLGVENYLMDFGIIGNYISEMDWGDSVMVGGKVAVTAVPARHFSGRSLLNRNQTLWSSFVIKGKKHNIFFGADSGYFNGFKNVGETFGPFDLSILEIGAYGKYWPDIHMGPDNASNAHLELNANIMMPIHWGTFNLAPHAWYEPIERLVNYAKEKDFRLFAPAPGEPAEVKQYNSEWWKAYL